MMRKHPWWPWAKRLAYFLFLGLVVYLISTQASRIDWDEVLAAMRRRTPGESVAAAALAATSFALYSCFDLLGRYYTGHRLAPRTVVTITFISYAFNLNLGSLIGGAAFRYRLYSRAGLDLPDITRVVLFSMLTNWLGYLLLAGVILTCWPLQLPADWNLPAAMQPVLGSALLLVSLSYLLLCALMPGRSWTVRGHDITLPGIRMALLQLAMSCTNWLLMAGAVYLLLQRHIEYPTVLAVLLVGAVAGVLTHVPAGLGVLEAAFVMLLSQRLPESELLAAILSYRVIYYFAPLLVAALVYLWFELRSRRPARA